jgi:hypothetical protein
MKRISLYQGEAKPLVIRIKDRQGGWSNLEDSICLLVVQKIPKEVNPVFTKLDADFDKTTARNGYLSLFLTPWETWQEPWVYLCQLEINRGGASLSKLLFEMEILDSVSANDFTIIIQGIESQEAFGTPNFVNFNLVSAGIESEEIFGEIAVSSTIIVINYNVAAVGIESREIVVGPALSPRTLLSGSIESQENFGAPAVSPSIYRIIFSIISMDDILSQETFGVPSLAPISIVPFGIVEQEGWFGGGWFVGGWFAGAEDVGEPIITTTYFIIAAMDDIASEESFGMPVLSPISLIPTTINASSAMGNIVVEPSVLIIQYNVAPVGASPQEVFGLPQISPMFIFPGGTVSQGTFGATVISQSATPVIRFNIVVSGITSAMAFGRPRMKRLPRAPLPYIYPAGIVSKQAFGRPRVRR